MHHRVASICLHRGSRLSCSHVFHDLSRALFRRAASVGPQLSSDLQDEGRSNLEVGALHSPKSSSKKAEGSDIIIIGDLAATLEAHRASNRAKIIRKIDQPPPQYQDWKRLAEVTNRIEARGNVEEASEAAQNDATGVVLATKKKKRPVRLNTKERSPHRMKTTRRRLVRRTGRPIESLQKRTVRPRSWNDLSEKGHFSLEYEHIRPHARGSWSQRNRSPGHIWKPYRPWLAYLDSTHEDRLERLSSEIRALEAYMRLTPAEEKASRLVVSDVMSILEGAFAPTEIQMFGSRSTGLATPLSDFDFSIVPTECADTLSASNLTSGRAHRSRVSKTLRRVHKRLLAAPEFKSVELIFARIIILRAVHRGTEAKVEFQTMSPIQASENQTKAWVREFPSLRPLFIALRMCLEAYDLTTVYEGGVGSYALTVMIVTALKHAKGAHDPNDVGGQLLHILDFWGSANLHRYAYSADPPLVYEKEVKPPAKVEGLTLSKALDLQRRGMDEIRRPNNERSYFLCLQDPANYLNDLGGNSYAIKDIQAVFSAVHTWMSKFVRTGELIPTRRGPHPECIATDRTRSVLYTMFQADFRGFERARSRLERFADPRGRENANWHDESVSVDQQVRAIEYRKRHGLETLISKPQALVDDWHIALGVRYVDPRPFLGGSMNGNEDGLRSDNPNAIDDPQHQNPNPVPNEVQQNRSPEASSETSAQKTGVPQIDRTSSI